MRGGGVLTAAVTGPGARRELQTTLVAVAGVDGPVAAGFAAGNPIPFAVGGGVGLAGEGKASGSEHSAREGDFRDAYSR